MPSKYDNLLRRDEKYSYATIRIPGCISMLDNRAMIIIQNWKAAITIIAALSIILFAAFPASAASVYEVQGVDVDVTAETAAAARQQALAEGEIDAFRRILERITLLEDRHRLPNLKPSEISAFIQDFSVAEEKTSAVRYLATLNYRFKRNGIRDLLIGDNIPFAETPSKTTLILPVYHAAGIIVLWDDPNPWRKAWAERQIEIGLVPTLLPTGDLTDIATIGAEQAVNGDVQRLTAVTYRYKAGDALVTYAVAGLSQKTGKPELRVRMTRHGGALDTQTIDRVFQARTGESHERLLARAATELSWLLEDSWKQDNLLQFDQRSLLTVDIPIKNLRDWLRMKKRLGNVAVVRTVDMVLLSKTAVRINLHYIGAVEQLSLALEQADLTLLGSGEKWVLNFSSDR
jgi:hypothetical protein